ncbi:MAG TPA: universal stress protein [Bacillota bacterium]|nr:universal stress protein [Bacillota bacterium]
MKLLIAYDGSACAEAALADLTRAGLPAKLQAMVLSVAEVWLPPDSPPPVPEAGARFSIAVQRAQEAAWRAVQEDSRHLAERGMSRLQTLFPQWSLTAKAVGDSPAWGIIGQAAEWGADLIVVGSHGRSAMERFFLGSVSHKVALEAPCSVHIARPRPGAAHTPRILLALDGSPDSLAAVRAVAARAWHPGAAVQLLTIVDSRVLTAPAWQSPVTEPWLRPDDTTGQEWIERALEASAQQLHSIGLAAETRLLEGDAKQLLLKHARAWEADCIFLGAHGLYHGPRRHLGSFVSAVATRAHCSVEIVRQKAAPGSEAAGRSQ